MCLILDFQRIPGGGTNTSGALWAAYETLLESPYYEPETNRVIFIITDGCPNNRERSQAIANRIKDKDVTIISVGIGNTDYSGLELVSSVGKSFTLQSFDILAELLREAKSEEEREELEEYTEQHYLIVVIFALIILLISNFRSKKLYV